MEDDGEVVHAIWITAPLYIACAHSGNERQLIIILDMGDAKQVKAYEQELAPFKKKNVLVRIEESPIELFPELSQP